MSRSFRLIVASVAILALGILASGQHGVSAKFDPTKPQTLKGTVTQVDWANPFTHIILKVPAAAGCPQFAGPSNWKVPSFSQGMDGVKPSSLRYRHRSGLSCQKRNQTDFGNSVLLARTNKNVLVGYNGTAPPKRRLPPVGALAGWASSTGPHRRSHRLWGIPSKTALVQDGATVQLMPLAFLKHCRRRQSGAISKWARDVYELRQKDFLAHDPCFWRAAGRARNSSWCMAFGFWKTPTISGFRPDGGGNRNERVMPDSRAKRPTSLRTSNSRSTTDGGR